MKEAQTDDSLGTDFSFQPSMPLSPVKSRWCQCVSSSCHSLYCCEPVTLVLCFLATERGRGGGAIARERDRGLFLHLTQRRSTASTPLDAIGESQKKEGRQPRLSVTLEEPAVQLTDNTSVPHGLVWYSPLGLADRLTGFHGGQANTKQIQTGGTELQ